MKFFTPELYMRFGSSDDKIANTAEAEWDAALIDYRKQLYEIRQYSSDRVKALMDLNLHDLEVMFKQQTIFTKLSSNPQCLTIILRNIDNCDIKTISYMLNANFTVYNNAPTGWKKAIPPRIYWGYEELSKDENYADGFIHEILFSDGTRLHIPFFDVVCADIPCGEIGTFSINT